MSRREKDEQQKLFQDVREQLSEVHNQWREVNNSLGQMQDTIDTIRKQRDSIPEDTENEFYNAINELTKEIEESDSAVEYSTYSDRLEKIHNRPFLSAIETAISNIYSELDLQEEKESENRFSNRIEAAVGDDTAQYLSIAEESGTKIRRLDEVGTQAVKQQLAERETLPADPKVIHAVVEDIRSKRNIITELIELADRTSWLSPLAESNQFILALYQLSEDDISRIKENIRHTEAITNELPEQFELKAILKTEIEERESDIIDNPSGSIAEIRTNVEEIAERRKEISELADIIDTIDPNSIESNFLVAYEDLSRHPENGLEDTVESLEDILRMYGRWKEDLEKRWKNSQSRIKRYQSALHSDPPKKVQENLNESLPIDSDPADAYFTVQSAEQWVDEKKDGVLQDVSPSAQDLFERLSDGNEYALSEDDVEDVRELVEFVDLVIRIDE